MKIYINNELNRLISASLSEITKERFLMQELDEYCQDNSGEICCLFGLRGTGKKTMMFQEIRKLGAENCAYIECGEGDSIHTLRETLEALSEQKNIFINQLSPINIFVTAAEFLVEQFVENGKKIILSGDDSLLFVFANAHSLNNSLRFIHTTFIPYVEYEFLTGKDTQAYIRGGGTLCHDTVFTAAESLYEYLFSAVAGNISRSLDSWYKGRVMTYERFDGMEPDEITPLIVQIIESLAVSVISALDMKFKDGLPYELFDFSPNRYSEENVLIYLESIDFLRRITDTSEYIFTQNGVIYGLAKHFADDSQENEKRIFDFLRAKINVSNQN